MLREIKFCGKRLDNGKWVYGHYHYRERENEHIIYHYTHSELLNMAHQMFGDKKNKKRLGLCMPKVDPETVGQYIGRKDNEDNELYEFDIVDDGDNKGIIEYNQDRAMWMVVPITDNITDKVFYPFDEWGRYKKIGNKFDNPELLEEKW